MGGYDVDSVIKLSDFESFRALKLSKLTTESVCMCAELLTVYEF